MLSKQTKAFGLNSRDPKGEGDEKTSFGGKADISEFKLKL